MADRFWGPTGLSISFKSGIRSSQFMSFSVGLCFCHLYSAVWMMGRCINCINFEWQISGIHHVVPSACRNKNSKSAAYRALKIQTVLGRPHHNYAIPAFKSEKLICVRMYLQADFSSNRDTHQRKLQAATCP